MHALWMEIGLTDVGDELGQICDEILERAVEPCTADPLWVRSTSELLALLVFDDEDQARRAAGRFVVGQQVGEPQGGATLASVRVGEVMAVGAAG
jgi:alkylation response protein AidB-like acyl-CoA dehydrogenase